jgi:flagellar motility protein MotE (MotC chaperone)
MNLWGVRVLPILMIVAAVAFGVRFSDFIKNLPNMDAYAATSGDLVGIDPAAGEAPPPPEDKLKDSKAPPELPNPADEKKGADAGTPVKTDKPVIEPPSLGEAPPAPKKKEEWKASDDLDDEYSEVKMELFTDLSKRRKDLEAKEKELVMREALLKAAQSELEQKTNELTTIKADIEALLKQQTEQEDERIVSLVKIYEGMKAKDAAKIFNALDMDVLLQVLTKMSERKSAPIIAAMDEDKARDVTILLAEQNKLPDLPQLPVQNP